MATSATLALLGVAGAARAQANWCLDASAPEGFTRQTIQLRHWVAVTGPHFYYRLLDQCCVVLLSADRVTGLLASSKNEQEQKLLTLIQKDVPLARDTDLFSYVVSSPVDVGDVQRLVADLLERGEAILFDVLAKITTMSQDFGSICEISMRAHASKALPPTSTFTVTQTSIASASAS